MFTGIVEGCGEVIALERSAGGARLRLGIPFAAELELGESVAVNGCCLTVAGGDLQGGEASFDLLDQTLSVTNLGALSAGARVNLERAVRVGDRLSGHLVQGHVDQAATVRAFRASGADYRLEVALAAEFRPWVISRGSIAVDGISLTVAELDRDWFSCWIIPHTREVTNLAQRSEGERVNLEFDLVGKYAVQALALRSPEPPKEG